MDGLAWKIFAGLFGPIVLLAVLMAAWEVEQEVAQKDALLRLAVDSVVDVQDAATAPPETEGCPVFVQGEANALLPIQDAAFGVTLSCIRMVRRVEFYQWQESYTERTHHSGRGATEYTTREYSYRKIWVEKPIASVGFQEPKGHQNGPVAIPQRTVATLSNSVRLCGFLLNEAEVGAIGELQPFSPNPEKIPPELEGRAVMLGGCLYVGSQGVPDPAHPQIGDARVSWSYVPNSCRVAVLACRRGDTLVPYMDKLDLVRMESYTDAQDFIHREKKDSLGANVGSFLMVLALLTCTLRMLMVFEWNSRFWRITEQSGKWKLALFLGAEITLLLFACAWMPTHTTVGVCTLLLCYPVFHFYRSCRRRFRSE